MSKPTAKRIFYFDILRTVACMAVIMIHVSAEFVYKPVGTVDFWIGNIMDSLSRFAVPIFVMLSGALLLDENYRFSKQKAIGHIKKMVIFFAFWSLAYSVMYVVQTSLINKEPFSIKTYIIKCLEGHYHLWYVYMIVGLYLITPILRKFVNKANKRYVEYFLCLSILFTFTAKFIVGIAVKFVPVLSFCDTILNNLNLQFVSGYTAYFILGWYLHHYDIPKRTWIYIVGIFGLVLMIGSTAFFSGCSVEPTLCYNNLGFPVFFTAVALFVWIKSMFCNRKSCVPRVCKSAVNTISRYSLGIYGVHVFFVESAMRLIVPKGDFHAVWCLPTVFVLALVLSLGTSYIFSKIPLLKKVV